MAEAIMAVCGCFALSMVAVLLFSFGSLGPTELGLRYDFVMQTVAPQVEVQAGVKFLGPTTRLLIYPKTIQTITYDRDSNTLLAGRTKDGLPLTLGITFQYRLMPDGVYNLYHTFEQEAGDYEAVYKLMATHLITEMATNFTAYQFFNEKQRIAEVMREEVNAYFQANFWSTVESLQINEDDLPDDFTQMILTAATNKQKIAKMEKTRSAMKVKFETAIIVAEAQANMTLQRANGTRSQILNNAHADAAIIDSYVEAELQAYTKIKSELDLKSAALVDYIWYDTLGGGGVSANSSASTEVQMLVGVDPAAYISGSAR
jgi:regulator of protease activity HflC (stomatin/prohibitin superfamily)